MDIARRHHQAHPQRPLKPLVVIATRRMERSHEQLEDELVGVLLAEAGKRGWELLDLSMTEGSLSGEQTPIGALVTALPDEPMVRMLRELGCPIVRLARLPHPQDESVPAVLPDYAAAGRMAADYFAQRGFREMAMVGHKKMQMMELVGEGFGKRAEALGCRYHLHQFTNVELPPDADDLPASRYDGRAQTVTKWLATLPKPIGLLACSDGLAGTVNIMCQRAGLAVPEDVALLSLGNRRAACELGPVPISAIDIGRQATARVAMEVLEDQINNAHTAPPRTLVPPAGIITRRSTDILAVADPTVARAIRFIWDHLDIKISVNDVAAAVNTPRYKLERLFRAHYKRGINAELRHARLERFSELLRMTDQTVDELAPQVGYLSSKRLHSVFRKAYGMTPRRYRLAARQKDEQTKPHAKPAGVGVG
jgi:LacI family transcriptional regulator